MIHRAPPTAIKVLGICRIVAGPGEGIVRYSGWAEVWLHRDGRKRVAFPAIDVVRAIRNPDTRMFWVKPIKSTTIWRNYETHSEIRTT